MSESEVVGIVLKNKARDVSERGQETRQADINISYSYSGAEEGSKRQLVVLGLSDVKLAIKALKKA